MLKATRKAFYLLNNKQKTNSLILVLMMIIGGMMESLGVSLILPLISAVMDTDNWSKAWYAEFICRIFHINEQRKYIFTLLLLLIIVFFVKNIYLLIEYYVQYSVISKYRYEIQKKLITSYLGREYEYYLGANYGEIVRVVTSDTEQVYLLFSSLLTFYTELFVSALMSVTIFAISPLIAGGLVVILVIELLLIFGLIKPNMKKAGDRNRLCVGNANKWILQTINGIKSIKVAKSEPFFRSNYNKYAEESIDTKRKYSTLVVLPKLIIESFTIAGVLVIIMIVFVSGSDLNAIIPQLSAFVLAAIKLLPSANKISISSNQIPFYEGGLDHVIKALNSYKCSGEIVTVKHASDIETLENKNVELTFGLKGVTYSYPNTNTPVLNEVDLRINQGESVGIIGQSGGGKTTTMDILLGLLVPQKGSVFMNDMDIRSCMDEWLSKTAYIPQQIFLMDASIKENIIFGRDNIPYSKELINNILRETQLEEFVHSLKDGIDTEVGEQGIRLSGGQKQRIGIARALYGNPDVLFFDEATSALDNETEAEIMDAINSLKGKKTLVIIAHRLSTIENCDVVYKVEDGRIFKENGKKL